MPWGTGMWYDRRRKRYIGINDHAIDAHHDPLAFRLTRKQIKHLNPIRDREAIIKLVCQQGFTRVRHYRGRLGWQFWGFVEDSLDELQGFFGKFEVGPAEVVTFTDLAAPGKINTVEGLAKDFANPDLTQFKPLLALVTAWHKRDIKVGS